MRPLNPCGPTIFVILLLLALTPLPTVAQEAPPDLGNLVVEDALAGPGVASASFCPTGRNSTRFVDGTWRFLVAGKCRETATFASIFSTLAGVGFVDGEMRVDVQARSGAERLNFVLNLRRTDDGSATYYVSLQPGRGVVALGKSVDGQDTSLARRTDLATLVPTEDWITVAVRAQGPRLWVLLNDQTVLSAEDGAYDSGRLAIGLARFGSPDDSPEASVAVRNLRVSALAGGDLARAPTFQPPTPAAAPPAPSPSGPILAAGTPPTVGAAIVEDALALAGTFPVGVSPTGRCSIQNGPEGRVITAAGRCFDNHRTVTAEDQLRGITFSDGELRFEARATSGLDRAIIGMRFRRASGTGGYYAFIAPGRGEAQIGTSSPEGGAVLARRTDLASFTAPDSWNTIAVRAQGGSLFLLLNDLPILSTTDSTHDVGAVHVFLIRLDDVNDNTEVSAVVKNLRMSALADGDPSRVPTFEQP